MNDFDKLLDELDDIKSNNDAEEIDEEVDNDLNIINTDEPDINKVEEETEESNDDEELSDADLNEKVAEDFKNQEVDDDLEDDDLEDDNLDLDLDNVDVGSDNDDRIDSLLESFEEIKTRLLNDMIDDRDKIQDYIEKVGKSAFGGEPHGYHFECLASLWATKSASVVNGAKLLESIDKIIKNLKNDTSNSFKDFFS